MRNHYKIHKPEPLELIQRYNLNFIEGNVVKYILRSPFKGNPVGDLKKALSYSHLLQDIGFYRQFDSSELDQYTELNAIEKEIVCDVIRADVTCTVQKLEKAIQEREKKKHKPFEPDWLPPHPMYTLLDLVDEDPCKFMEILETKSNKSRDPRIGIGCITLFQILNGCSYFIEALSELDCGSKDFWKNRYRHYWEKRNEMVRP